MKKIIILMFACFSGILGCNKQTSLQQQTKDYAIVMENQKKEKGIVIDDYNDFLYKIPEYNGNPFVIINDNQPNFKKEDFTTTAFELYSDLDFLGRCEAAFVNVGRETMPKNERKTKAGIISPSGWDSEKPKSEVHNICHLINCRLTGEDMNEKNLITGTKYLSEEGMLPFEVLIQDYIQRTGNHVLYRVTPIFEGNNLMANGVQLEAASVEDEEIRFNVYCYNVQPDYQINYEDGSITKSEKIKVVEEKYIGDMKEETFHRTFCDSLSEVEENNKIIFHSRNNATEFSKCKKCNP